MAAAIVSTAVAAVAITAAASTAAIVAATVNQHFNGWFVLAVASCYVASCYVIVAARFCCGLACTTVAANSLVLVPNAAAAGLNVAAAVVFVCGTFATARCCDQEQ